MKKVIQIASFGLLICSACDPGILDTGCDFEALHDLTNTTWNDPEQGLELVIRDGLVLIGDGTRTVDFTLVGTPAGPTQPFCFKDRPKGDGLRTIAHRSGAGDFRIELTPRSDVVVERPIINKAILSRPGEPDQEVSLETNMFEGTAAIILRNPADERPFSLEIEAQVSLQSESEVVTETIVFPVEGLSNHQGRRTYRMIVPAACL